MSRQVEAKIIKAAEAPIEKALESTEISNESNNNTQWLSPPAPLQGLKVMVEHSPILPQCIRAYKDNISGFGVGLRYKEEGKETDEKKAEWNRIKEIVDLLNTDKAVKEIFERVIEARETYGISYLEVIRNINGEVVEVSFIKDTPTVKKTMKLDPYVDTTFFYNGKGIKRRKKFCKYRQEKNGKTVYFKEFGDPRIMDLRNGEYADEKGGKTVDIGDQANEILEFAIGEEPFGTIRWIGQVLSVDGVRKAENLNNNYFENGRHTPLAVIVSGGTLSDESFTRIQEYMNGIKGENGQHAFLLLEVEDTDQKAGFEENKKPTVELKDMAAILQKDELFQEYIENARKKVQSAFRLPDLYTGYTTDFNRATAQTAMEITEKQVFQPERESLAWIINNKLLNAYAFKYVEVYFKGPDITNPDDVTKLMNVFERAGGVTPIMAKQAAYQTMGWDGEEDYTEEWGNIPLAVLSKLSSPTAPSDSTTMAGLEKAIAKAAAAGHDDVLCIMKDVRKLLRRLDKAGVES